MERKIMTRANLNYIYQNMGEAPKTLFQYWNGDQYPTGIRDSYHVLDFIKSDWTPEAFTEWISKNYSGEKPKLVTQPKVYYTDGFITDYTYVFDATTKTVKVWNWDKLKFTGDVKKFTSWIKRQV